MKDRNSNRLELLSIAATGVRCDHGPNFGCYQLERWVQSGDWNLGVKAPATLLEVTHILSW